MPARTITCDCGKRLRLREGYEGKRLLCPGCKSPLMTDEQVPEPAPQPSEPQWIFSYKSLGLVSLGFVFGILTWALVTIPSSRKKMAEENRVDANGGARLGSPEDLASHKPPSAGGPPPKAASEPAQDPAMLDEREELEETAQLSAQSRHGEAERKLRRLRSPLAKARLALVIGVDDPDLRSRGVKDFDPAEAKRLVAESLPVLKQRAQVDASVSRTLGSLYRLGIGVERSPDMAFRHYLAAAEKQDKAAMHQLGYCYLEGSGVSKNLAEALKWLNRAAELKYSPALVGLGLIHHEGLAVEKDDEKALKLYEEAALLGNVDAMVQAADLNGDFGSKIGDTSDISAKLKRFKYLSMSQRFRLQAALEGSYDAMALVGMLEQLDGLLGNPEIARLWLERACETKLAFPLMCLGGSYLGGWGQPADSTRAEELFREALTAAKRDKQDKLVTNINKILSETSTEKMHTLYLSALNISEPDPIAAAPEPDAQPKVAEAESLVERPEMPQVAIPERDEPRNEGIPLGGKTTATKLQIVDSAWQPTPTGRYIKVQGRIKNVSDSPLPNVMATVTFEDARGRLVLTSKGIVNPNPIQPGEIASFEVMEPVDPNFDHYRCDFSHIGGGSIPTAQPSLSPRTRRRR